MKKIGTVKVDKKSFPLLMGLMSLKNLKCKFCKKKIRKDNFGLVGKEVVSCNSFICLTEAVEYLKKKGYEI